MKSKLLVHFASIVFVSVVLILVAVIGTKQTENPTEVSKAVKGMPDLSFVDFGNPFQKALTYDVMNIFFPGNFDKNRQIIESIVKARDKAFREKLQEANTVQHLSWEKCIGLAGMYIKFILVYCIVMVLTYYGVQTIGVWRFCRKKNFSAAGLQSFKTRIFHFCKQTVLGIASFILFCPAYVIAYSLRTELNTDTIFFMIILCVISNGLLMVYSNKFYAFLVSESRKGYVDTAIVKNLKNSYGRTMADGISLKELLRPIKRFDGHVFDHIFHNARHQYLSTIKEQASFLITGMIITEMALNLHGYLNYELLRQMLYGNIDIVVAMLLLIFYTVKATEIFTDYLVFREDKKYENQ